MKMKKFEHPKFSGYLITEPNETIESVAADYLGDDLEPGDMGAFTVTEVEMTQEEIDALPEFDG
jgi:hypothetical protein